MLVSRWVSLDLAFPPCERARDKRPHWQTKSDEVRLSCTHRALQTLHKQPIISTQISFPPVGYAERLRTHRSPLFTSSTDLYTNIEENEKILISSSSSSPHRLSLNPFQSVFGLCENKPFPFHVTVQFPWNPSCRKMTSCETWVLNKKNKHKKNMQVSVLAENVSNSDAVFPRDACCSFPLRARSAPGLNWSFDRVERHRLALIWGSSLSWGQKESDWKARGLIWQVKNIPLCYIRDH